ncbi:MAG: hypothetical protein ACJ8C4_07215 [Gemmataceae bacterium]
MMTRPFSLAVLALGTIGAAGADLTAENAKQTLAAEWSELRRLDEQNVRYVCLRTTTAKGTDDPPNTSAVTRSDGQIFALSSRPGREFATGFNGRYGFLVGRTGDRDAWSVVHLDETADITRTYFHNEISPRSPTSAIFHPLSVVADRLSDALVADPDFVIDAVRPHDGLVDVDYRILPHTIKQTKEPHPGGGGTLTLDPSAHFCAVRTENRSGDKSSGEYKWTESRQIERSGSRVTCRTCESVNDSLRERYDFSGYDFGVSGPLAEAHLSRFGLPEPEEPQATAESPPAKPHRTWGWWAAVGALAVLGFVLRRARRPNP